MSGETLNKVEKQNNKYMIKSEILEAKRELSNWLTKHTQCAMQEGEDGFPYPCGTCFIALLDDIGLKNDNKAYDARNAEVDRGNEVWRAILQIRDFKVE